MNKLKYLRKNSLLWCFLLILFVAGTTGCSKSEQKKKPAATPAPTQKVIENPEDSSSNLGLWTRAMGSVLIEINEGDPYVFGGYEKTENNKKAAAQILASSWNINNRNELLQQIQLLLKTGDRLAYRKEAKEMKAMSRKKLKTAMKQLSGELLIHYQTVQYHLETWGQKGLLAWDMCRISHLVQWGYIADYLSLEEAQAMIEPAAKKLKSNFKSWDEVQNNWLDGYCLFASIDRKASHTDYTNRKALYETLKKEQTPEKLLFDDSLFEKEIIRIEGVSYKTILKEIAPTPAPTKAKTKKSKHK